jgi:diacylglycerol kinase family enzyme
MRVLIIVNTKSGGSDAGLYDFARIVGTHGAEVVLRFLQPGQSVETLMADAASFDRVVAAGGDGTVSAVCYAMRDTRVPVLVYPAGTANLLALNLGLPFDAAALARITLEGTPVAFDLGELEYGGNTNEAERTGFAVMAGAGYDAAIMESAQSLKSAFGATAYLLAAVSNLQPTHSDFELVLDGEHISTDGIAILLVNFGRIQFDLALTHRWDPRDGLFDVVVVRSRNVAELIPSMLAIVADRVGEFAGRGPGVEVHTASRVEVSAYPQLKMQYDGETIEALTPFAARVLPGAATLLVPSGSAFADLASAPD